MTAINPDHREAYQYDYSKIRPESVFDVQSRLCKARTILAVLQDRFLSHCHHLKLLDVGCSTGIITDFLADYFEEVVGIDIDANAIQYAQSTFRRSNLAYHCQDSLHIPAADHSFHVVICAHVYEHVPDAERLMAEIYRVLKPRGVCYFAAGNRLVVREPHYGLPFLSWLPRPAADAYLKLFRRGEQYYEKHLSLWGLQRLVRDFTVHDYTHRLIETPHAFGLDYLLREGTRRHRLAVLAVRHFYWLCPTYIWLLDKPVSPSA